MEHAGDFSRSKSGSQHAAVPTPQSTSIQRNLHLVKGRSLVFNLVNERAFLLAPILYFLAYMLRIFHLAMSTCHPIALFRVLP